MGIKMNPPQFSDQRRQDPKRGSEARVFDALQNLDLEGYGLYEYRFRRDGKQVDYPLWVTSLGRFAVQVKGGTYEMDQSDQWLLLTPGGDPVKVSSPLEEAADGCMELRDGMRRATSFGNFVAGVVMFTDMERNEEIEHMAWERYHVSVIWGLESLEQDLQRIAEEVDFRRPPNSWVSEKEWRMVYQLQSGEVPGRRDADRHVQEVNRRPAAGEETERQVDLGSATFNIQHLDRLIVLYYPPERDGDGQLLIPEV